MCKTEARGSLDSEPQFSEDLKLVMSVGTYLTARAFKRTTSEQEIADLSGSLLNLCVVVQKARRPDAKSISERREMVLGAMRRLAAATKNTPAQPDNAPSP